RTTRYEIRGTKYEIRPKPCGFFPCATTAWASIRNMPSVSFAYFNACIRGRNIPAPASAWRSAKRSSKASAAASGSSRRQARARLFISPCRRQRLKAYLVKKAYLVSARATWHLASRPCLRDTRNEMRDTHLIFLRDTLHEIRDTNPTERFL